jgi:hypothetical protein
MFGSSEIIAKSPFFSFARVQKFEGNKGNGSQCDCNDQRDCNAIHLL